MTLNNKDSKIWPRRRETNTQGVSAGSKLVIKLREFGACRSGNIAMLFGLMAFLLFGATGSAIDFVNVYSAKSKTQNALDAAVLAGARGILVDDLRPAEDIEQKIRNLTEETLADRNWTNDTFDVVVGSNSVDARIVGELPTAFLSLFGMDALTFDVRANAALANINLEIALVVDTTGSIRNNGHVGTITSSLQNLINDLEALEPKIALVPFSETVNLGDNFEWSWIDMLGLSPTHGIMFDESVLPVNHLGLFTRMGMSWNGCVEMRPMPYDTTDEPPNLGNPSTLWVPFFGPSVNWFANYLNNGYVAIDSTVSVVRDREHYDPSNLSGVADPSHPGDNYDPVSNCNRNPIIPLTTNYSSIQSAIGGMDFDGGTTIPAGLAWGWRVLSPGEPFTEGGAYGDGESRKIMVLLSDGKNEMGIEYNAYGMYYDGRLGQSGTDETQMSGLLNDRMQQLCTNIKAAGIELYIISYALDNDAETQAHKAMMEQCATSVFHHYDAEDATALGQAFSQIVERETRLWLKS